MVSYFTHPGAAEGARSRSIDLFTDARSACRFVRSERPQRLEPRRSAKGADRQHSLFAWMQLWIIFFRAGWLHALKKSACIV